MKLTNSKINATKPISKDQWLNDGNGLYLRVYPTGSKVWVIRRKRGGKTQIIRLDTWENMSIKEARLAAAEYSLKGTVSGVTVADLVEKYTAAVVSKHKRPELFEGYMRRAVLPQFGRRKVRDITTMELANMIENYANTRGGWQGNRSADQLRSNTKKLFAYAVSKGYRPDNPMLAIDTTVSGYKAAARDRVLSDDEIRLLWAEKSPNARVLRFLLLTGVRISEAQQGHPDAAEGDRWIIPADLSKTGVPHWVHLTESSKAQLPLPACSPTNIQAWLRRWCDKHKIDPRFTPHDCRRTFSTRLNDADVAPYVVEKLLNHTMQGVMAVYNRAEYEADRIAGYELMASLITDVLKKKTDD